MKPSENLARSNCSWRCGNLWPLFLLPIGRCQGAGLSFWSFCQGQEACSTTRGHQLQRLGGKVSSKVVVIMLNF